MDWKITRAMTLSDIFSMRKDCFCIYVDREINRSSIDRSLLHRMTLLYLNAYPEQLDHRGKYSRAQLFWNAYLFRFASGTMSMKVYLWMTASRIFPRDISERCAGCWIDRRCGSRAHRSSDRELWLSITLTRNSRTEYDLWITTL